MKNKLLALATLLWVVFSFSACSDEDEVVEKVKLATPELTQTLNDHTSFTVSWQAVENAVAYMCDMDGQTTETSDLSITFSGLEEASSHVVKVKAVADANSNYQDSEWAEMTVQLQEKGADFEITCKVSGKNVDVTVKPADKKMAYYSEILSDADYKDYGGDPVKAFQQIINFYKEIFGEGTFDFLKDMGDVSYSMDMDAYNLDAYVFAAGIDEDLNITTEVAMQAFKTDPLPLSDNTFDIKLLEKGPAKAVFHVTPSNNDPYTMIVMEKEDLKGYTDDDLHSLFSNEYKGWIREHLYKGEMDMTYTDGLFPDTEYILFVFGWDTEPNTELNRFEFTTDKPSEGSDMTFEFEAEVQGPTDIYTKVVPSDPEALYFTDVIKKSDVDKYGADHLDDYYKDICENNGGFPFIDYMQLFVVVGTCEYLYDYLDPNTEYVLMAVPLTLEDDNVLFHTPQFYDGKLVTPAE